MIALGCGLYQSKGLAGMRDGGRAQRCGSIALAVHNRAVPSFTPACVSPPRHHSSGKLASPPCSSRLPGADRSAMPLRWPCRHPCSWAPPSPPSRRRRPSITNRAAPPPPLHPRVPCILYPHDPNLFRLHRTASPADRLPTWKDRDSALPIISGSDGYSRDPMAPAIESHLYDTSIYPPLRS